MHHTPTKVLNCHLSHEFNPGFTPPGLIHSQPRDHPVFFNTILVNFNPVYLLKLLFMFTCIRPPGAQNHFTITRSHCEARVYQRAYIKARRSQRAHMISDHNHKYKSLLSNKTYKMLYKFVFVLVFFMVLAGFRPVQSRTTTIFERECIFY